jgi:mRNA interferase HigB
MRLISARRLEEFWRIHPRARVSLESWLSTTRGVEWNSFSEVRKTFSHADQVRVGSRKTVVVFNIAGNNFRLICAIHYNGKRIYLLRFLTHAEYSKDKWKNDL